MDYVISLLYEKTLEYPIIDKKIDEKEALEMKKICNNYLDKRKGIMRNTQLKVEDIFADIISQSSISPKQSTKLNKFLSQKNI